MKAVAILRHRAAAAEDAFSELVIWRIDKPVAPSRHQFKYRLAYVVRGECVVLYDNERGKDDHRHFGDSKRSYSFSSPEKLMADFSADIERWNRENGRS